VTNRRASTAGRRDAGAAAVEMALLMPLLLLLVFGIIDFGRMLNAQITVTEAAREGARAASLSPSQNPSVIEADASARVNRVAAGFNATTTVVSNCIGNPAPGDDATVQVTYQFKFATPVGFFAGLLPNGSADGSMPLTSTGVMPCRA
jgi:Flp pilus assembly protein TadG